MTRTRAEPSKLVAPLARRRTQLMEKGKTRSHRAIHKRLPAGAGDLARIPKGKEFQTALPTGEGGTDVKAYCKAVRGATATFKDGHRATQTALEHDMFMRIINNWAVRSGFGTFVVDRKDRVAGMLPPTVQIAKDDATGEPKVLKPEMVVGMLLEMATGDENVPKGGHPDDLARMASSEAKNVCGPRRKWKRKKGEHGYGAYSNEPWGLQSMEKRVYAIRDFYKRELKGTSYENPGLDELVVGTLAALVLLIGRKAMHVPQVRTERVAREPCATARTTQRETAQSVCNQARATATNCVVRGGLMGAGMNRGRGVWSEQQQSKRRDMHHNAHYSAERQRPMAPLTGPISSLCVAGAEARATCGAGGRSRSDQPRTGTDRGVLRQEPTEWQPRGAGVPAGLVGADRAQGRQKQDHRVLNRGGAHQGGSQAGGRAQAAAMPKHVNSYY